MTYDKKGQVNLRQAPGAIQVLVVIGIFIAIAALIMVNISRNDTGAATAVVSNETFTPVANTPVAMNNDNWVLTADVTVINASDGLLLANKATDGGYNYSATQGTVTLGATNSSSDKNVSYTYNVDTAFVNVTNESLSGFSTFGDFIPLIALVVAAAIILGLVRVFG